jgi:hypothetical protein
MTGIGAEQGDHLTSALGTVTAVTRHGTAIVYLDVTADVESIQAGWPEFESRFTSLRGRSMMTAVYPERGVYRLATAMRDEDDPDALGLQMGLLPGGPYLRLSLRGEILDVHRSIGPAFDELHRLGERDPSRPCLEVYVSPTAVDCFLPVRG